MDDFEKIPVMDKHNYVSKYPVEDRLYNSKKLEDFYMICSSSGTSGEPTFWPRDYQSDLLLEKKKQQTQSGDLQANLHHAVAVNGNSQPGQSHNNDGQ